MNKGVIFFIIVVLAILAVIFIPKNKDNAPVMNTIEEMDQNSQADMDGSINLEGASTIEIPSTEVSAEGVVEVPTTETTPAVSE